MNIIKNILCRRKCNTNIYIYGVGVYGKALLNKLKDSGVNVKGFLISEGKESFYDDVPIRLMKSCINYINIDDIIVLGLSQKNQQQVLAEFPIIKRFNIMLLNEYELFCLKYETFIKYIYSLSSRYPAEHELKKEQWRKIMVVRLDVIGDFIVTTPFLRELRRNFPKSEITLVVRDALLSFVALCPYVDYIKGIHYSEKEFYSKNYKALEKKARIFSERKLLKEGYDVVFLPRAVDMDELFLNILIALYSKAKVRVGRYNSSTPVATVKAKIMTNLFSKMICHSHGEHEVVRMLDMLTAIGVDYKFTHLEFWLANKDNFMADNITKERSEIAIAVGLVSRDKNRSWTVEKYRILLDMLQKIYGEKLCFILVGGDDAREAAKYVSYSKARTVNLCARTTLTEAAAVIKCCKMYLGANTGLLHIAAAFGLKIVEISAHLRYGDPNGDIAPQRYGAWQVPCIVLQPQHGLDEECEKAGYCKKTYSHCINQITVKEVCNAVQNMLEI